MRMRIISAVAVVCLGVVGIGLAQPPGEGRGDDRAKLRTRVAELRAEIELLQLEHDVEVDLLKKLMTDMKNLDMLAASKGAMKEQLEALAKGPLKGRVEEAKRQMEALKESGSPLAQFLAGGNMGQDLDAELSLDEATGNLCRPILERWRKEFIQRTTGLNEKRLELAEAEKRYNEAK